MWYFPNEKYHPHKVNSLTRRIHEEFFGGRPLKDEIVLYLFNRLSMEPEPETLKQGDYRNNLKDESWFVYALQ
jgi:MarR-like DNA-binding transcriptional regulator SgrR of sgrS sRNA